MSRPVVLHLTFDFPTPLVPRITPAVQRLVDGAGGFRNVVYAMHRVGFRRGVEVLEFAADRFAVAYGGEPKGLFLLSRLRELARWVEADIAARGLKIDLIHAHRFSMDGLIADHLSRALGAPFICGLWGDADSWVMRGRPDLLGLWREVADRAGLLLPVAPWAVDRFSSLLRTERSKMRILPVMAQVGDPLASAPRGPTLASVFHLDAFRRKGAPALVHAVASLASDHRALRLDIHGGGTARSFHDLARLIRRADALNVVRLRGPARNTDVQGLLNGYAGYVMPSRRETFGMAFVEALFAGLPVLFPKGWAIDGFFPAERIGYACDADDPDDVVKGVATLIADEANLKRSIADLQSSGGLDFLRPESISREYRAILQSALLSSSGER